MDGSQLDTTVEDLDGSLEVGDPSKKDEANTSVQLPSNEELDAEVELKKPIYMIDPNSTWKRYFDIFILLLVVYNAVATPMAVWAPCPSLIVLVFDSTARHAGVVLLG